MYPAVALWVLQLAGLLSLAVSITAFVAPFVILRGRGTELKPVTLAILVTVSVLFLILLSTYKPTFNTVFAGDFDILLVGLGLLPLGVAAGSRGGWRPIALAAGVLGLVTLALMAWGPFYPRPMYAGRGPFPPDHNLGPSAITPLTWAMLLAGTLVLFAPRRWAPAVGAALLWLTLIIAGFQDPYAQNPVVSSFDHVVYMIWPALMAVAAVLSAWVSMGKGHPSAPPDRGTSGTAEG